MAKDCKGKNVGYQAFFSIFGQKEVKLILNFWLDLPTINTSFRKSSFLTELKSVSDFWFRLFFVRSKYFPHNILHVSGRNIWNTFQAPQQCLRHINPLAHLALIPKMYFLKKLTDPNLGVVEVKRSFWR